jgi:hypothetical protein
MSALFDEEPEAATAPTNFLIVPPTIPADQLQAYEEAFRNDRRRHFVIFSEDDESTGLEVFMNAGEFRKAMNWPRDPTIEEAGLWQQCKL